MAMATTTTPIEESTGDQWVVFSGIGWSGYQTLLRLRGERKWPRLVCLDEDVYLMSPGHPHEFLSERLSVFVMELVIDLDIPCRMAGSTTYHRKKKRGGVEPDKSFYLASAEKIRGREKTGLDLRRDPPPDLVVEVVYSHGADHAIEVYRRFGVPEVWLCERGRLRILALGEDGEYSESETSVSFPFLKATEVADWIFRQGDLDTAWARDLRQWVRETLAPRRAQQGG